VPVNVGETPSNAAAPPAQTPVVRYVTLAYGGAPGVYRQSVMLLLSLVAHAPAPYELVVATDRPECYVWFGTRVDIEYLDFARLEAWCGPRPFSMRQKLELARAALSNPGSELQAARPAATVLLDADVLAIKPFESFVRRLLDGDIFMHRREYVLCESRRAGNRKLWNTLRRLEGFSFGPTDAMWNSGVLALPTADRGLLDEAIALYDGLGAAGVRHFATEQLVEGVVLGRTGRLHAADAWFTHYWGNKSGWDAEIARRLADAFIEGMSVKDAAARFKERPIDLPEEIRRTPAQKLAKWIEGPSRT
jgi:hypothetical protein